MKIQLFITLIFVSLLSFSESANINIVGTVRDFTPLTSLDFEPTATGDDRNIASTLLDVDGKPIYNSATAHPTVSSATSFAAWFRDVVQVNVPIMETLVLTDTAGTYTFDSDAYFPVDNIGYGNYLSSGHNYHFTSEFHFTFTGAAAQVFTFTGNDDVFIFVNGMLVGDLGGVHASETVTVNVASLSNFVSGGTNTLDLYHAQRSSLQGSSFHISTNIVLTSGTSSASPNPGRDAGICSVTLSNFCPGSVIPAGDTPSDILPTKRDTTCPNDPTVTFPGSTAYSFDGFNVISFDSFTATTGDVEGRVAVRNTFSVGNGYSIGAEIRTGGTAAWDLPYPYDLVVGGNCNYGSGAVFPDGTGIPFPGDQENIFCGGKFTSSEQDLVTRTNGTCQTASCLDSDFVNAQAYYTQLQASFAAITNNVDYTVQYGTLNINCRDATASSYSANVMDTDFNTVTSYSFSSVCNPSAQFVLNIVGSSTSVSFSGDNQHYYPANDFLYNILGSGKTISVSTEVDGSILAPNNALKQTSGVIKGIVIVGNVISAWQINRLYCDTPASPPHIPPNTPTPLLCPSFETQCAGLDLPLDNGVYSFRDFNVISFSNYVAMTGDIEGRLAAQNDVTLGGGYSIGAELSLPNDNNLPYSLVAGGDITWTSGALFPQNDASGMTDEEIFCGGTFTQVTGNDLVPRRTGGPCSQPGCLDVYFNAARTCYRNYQDTLASYNDNVQTTIQWSALIITCNDMNADTYYVSITPAQIATFTYTSLSNCNFQATWVINVRGSGDVVLSGGSFPSVPGAAVYNIIGSRTVNITETAVNGHILAPDATIYQPGGVIIGKVVAGNIAMALQINKQNVCPIPSTVNIPIPVAGNSYPGESTDTSGSSSTSSSSSDDSSDSIPSDGSTSSGGQATSTGDSNTGSSNTGDNNGPQPTTIVPLASYANLKPGDTLYFNGGSSQSTILSLLILNGKPAISILGTHTINAQSLVYVLASNMEGRPSNVYVAPQQSSASSNSIISFCFMALLVLLI